MVVVSGQPVAVNQTGNSAVPVVTAEPITVFHFEVMAVGDANVARMTSQLLHVSCCLIIVALVNFIWDLGRSSLTTTGAVWNLLTALALPACGIVGVKDKNITCIQYFCCCNYLCAFLTFVSLISAIVMLITASDQDDTLWYVAQLVLLSFFFVVYCRGGGLSQKLQEQPYFTQDRTNPRTGFNVHQNTTEVNVQPVAQAVFVSPAAPPVPSYISSPSQPVVVSGEVVQGAVIQPAPISPTYLTGNGGASGDNHGLVTATAVAVPAHHSNAIDRNL